MAQREGLLTSRGLPKIHNARLPAHELDWWKSAVLYQIYPRSLRDQDGDGIGDLKGLISRLPEIKTLGVDALWVCPFFKSPMKDFGYDIEDHCEVDPLFGDLADAQLLIERAHQIGLRIMIDLVISHTSDQHEWFKESRRARDLPESDYYVWADPHPDGSPPNNWLSIFGGSAWKWDTRRRQYYLHNFLVSQPDLNFHHAEVRARVLKVARFWLELGVDGFRLDTVNFYFHDLELRSNVAAATRDNASAPESNPYGWQDHVYDKNRPEVLSFLRELRVLLDEFPGRVALGEIGESPSRSLELLVEYTQPGHLHLCYSFDLLSPQGDASYWRGVIERFEAHVGDQGLESWPCWAFSNHDVIRAATRLCPQGGSVNKTGRLLMALLLSLRGTPCLYQGEELALPEVELSYEELVDPYGIEFWPDFKGRDGCRTPYPWEASERAGFSESSPWLPIGAEHRSLSFQSQARDESSALHVTRALIALRSRHPALARGSITLCESHTEILVFERHLGEDRVTCLFNPSKTSQRWKQDAHPPVSRQVLLASGEDVETAIHEAALEVTLPAQSWLFLG